MSSSTMIHGATVCRVKTYRIPVDRTTMPASQAQTGTARTKDQARSRVRPGTAASTAKPDLVEADRELGRGRVVGADPDLGRRLRDVAEHRLVDRGSAGRLLDGGGVEVGHALEPVLALDQLA